MRNQCLRGLSVLAVMFLASACALSEDVVEVNYISETTPESLGVDGKQFTLDVIDLRGAYFGRISAKVNGYGYELADIKSTIPVRDIVFLAIEEELFAREIELSSSAAPALEIEITTLHSQFQIGAFAGTSHGNTTLTVTVKNTSGLVLYNEISVGTFVLEDVFLATGENAALAVEGAMSKAIKNLFEDQKFLNALVVAK